MWYVIQTVTGKEEELIAQIRKTVPKQYYRDCFLIEAEWLKRLGGKWQISVRPLFPGYVFIDTDAPDDIFFSLRQVPKFSRLLGTDRFEFTAAAEEERQYLLKICGKSEEQQAELPGRYLVALSTVETRADGMIRRITGPLGLFRSQIERIHLHKRYAIVRLSLCHREQTILFGFRLEQKKGKENQDKKDDGERRAVE